MECVCVCDSVCVRLCGYDGSHHRTEQTHTRWKYLDDLHFCPVHFVGLRQLVISCKAQLFKHNKQEFVRLRPSPLTTNLPTVKTRNRSTEGQAGVVVILPEILYFWLISCLNISMNWQLYKGSS